jgi:predicted metalloprotease
MEQRGSGSGGGGLGGLPIPGGKGGGIGAIVVLLIVLFLGGRSITGGDGGGGFGLDDGGLNGLPANEGQAAQPITAPTESQAFIAFVLDDVQQTWGEQFRQAGRQYQNARLALFTNSVNTRGCGNAPSAVGPFYCPADGYVYIDESFFDELSQRFGAPGDFAKAYVIAHELGHHVQNLLGIDDQVREAVQRNPGDQNELSVRQELQADCLAGVWGHSANERGLLEAGDVEEGLDAAAAVGDDRIQEQSTGRVDPETWTHGSSASRQKWFNTGYHGGDPQRCDTFAAGAV